MEMVQFIPPKQRKLVMLATQADTAPVLIHGTHGTGKGAIAKWIHLNSPRATKKILSSSNDRPILEQLPDASGGTMILNEIGECPLGEQARLLDFLNTRSIPHPQSPDTRMLLSVRIIATTSQSLQNRVASGLFNAELFKKLSVFQIDMPDLKNRKEEFEDIVLGILGEITRSIHKQHLRQLSPEAWRALKTYDWPGNLRELRNVLTIAIEAAAGDQLEASDLPQFGHEKLDFRATREEFEKIRATGQLSSQDSNNPSDSEK